MTELTVTHLAPYLPYNLQVLIKGKVVELWMLCATSAQTRPSVHGYTYCAFKDLKPILKPLSDLNKNVELNGETKTYLEHLNFEASLEEDVFLFKRDYLLFVPEGGGQYNLLGIPQEALEFLSEHHFDIFRLIEKNMAIDYNKLGLDYE